MLHSGMELKLNLEALHKYHIGELEWEISQLKEN